MANRGVVHPLLSTQRHVIAGRDFIARVEADGCRVGVQSDEEGAWWVLGVEPGGLAETGATPGEAYLRFSEAFKDVLSDLAEDAGDFDAFRVAVETFVHEVNRQTEVEWRTAAEAFRKGLVRPEPPFDTLPKKSADTPCTVKVERQDKRAAFKSVDAGIDEPAFARAA